MGTYNQYPQEVHDYIKKWGPVLPDRELAEKCNRELGTNFSAGSLKAFRANHNYYFGRRKRSDKEYWKYQTVYPQGMYEYIRDNSAGVSSSKMAEMVNEKFGTHYTKCAIKQFRTKHGIKSGLTGRFEKGRKSWNKGKKIEEYMSPEAIEKFKRAQFQKGNKPVNEAPVGTIIVNREGYKEIKIKMEGKQRERWVFLHRLIWEENNGPIPEGMNVTFKDGDRLNCSINNLMLVSKSENIALTRNDFRFKDPELTETGLNIIRLKKAAEKRKNATSETIGKTEERLL